MELADESPLAPDAHDSAYTAGCCPAPIAQTAAEEIRGLFRFAVARLGFRSNMAEDVVQQALVVAIAHRSPPVRADEQRAWLRGIVHNVIRSESRRARRRDHAHRQAGEEAASHGGSTSGGEVPGVSSRRPREVEALYLAVTELDEADQDLFLAYYRAGRSQLSIAQEYGTSEKGIEARLYRLRAKLRSLVATHLEAWS